MFNGRNKFIMIFVCDFFVRFHFSSGNFYCSVDIVNAICLSFLLECISLGHQRLFLGKATEIAQERGLYDSDSYAGGDKEQSRHVKNYIKF